MLCLVSKRGHGTAKSSGAIGRGEEGEGEGHMQGPDFVMQWVGCSPSRVWWSLHARPCFPAPSAFQIQQMKQRKYNRSHPPIWNQNNMATKGNAQAGELLKTWPLVLELDLVFSSPLFILIFAKWPGTPLCSWSQIAFLWLQEGISLTSILIKGQGLSWLIVTWNHVWRAFSYRCPQERRVSQIS